MSNKILVTGSTGTIGKELVKVLLAQHANFVAAIRHTSRQNVFGNTSVPTIVLDYEDEPSIENAFIGIHTLFLLLPPMNTKAGISLGGKLIDSAKKHNIQHIVHLSAMGAENDKYSYHYPIEKHLINSNICYTILRPNFFMQNFSHYFACDIINKNRIHIYDANTPTSFIDVRDIAAVAAKVLINHDQHQNQRYTLTGPQSLNHNDVAQLLSQKLGRKIKYTAVSEKDTRETLSRNVWPEDATEKFILVYKGVQQGIFSPVTNDVTQVLNTAPKQFNDYINDYHHIWNDHTILPIQP